MSNLKREHIMPKTWTDRYYDAWASSPENQKKIQEENAKEQGRGAFAVPVGGKNYEIRRRNYPIPGVLRLNDIELPSLKALKKVK